MLLDKLDREKLFVSFHLKCASGKDNREKLYALWVLLKSAEERGLEHFHVFGDSKLMRDWTNQ